jgi:hypothetical protein
MSDRLATLAAPTEMGAGTVEDDERVRRMRAGAQVLAGGVREHSALGVVTRVFAIQAQDRVAADLGIRVRGRDITERDVRAAYEDDRSIVRGWFLRGTLHTIPGPDVRWVLRLLAPRLLAATGRRYAQLGLTDALRDRAMDLLRRVLSVHGPLPRAELTEYLTTLGVAPDGQAAIHVIRHAALTGVLCHGPLRTGDATYVLLDDWLPATTDSPADEDTALAELARRYLAGHAPAAETDFAVWSGLPVTQARTAWRTLAQSGAVAEYGTLTVPAGWAPDRLDGTPDVRLLPAYDDYLLGYRNRDLSVPGYWPDPRVAWWRDHPADRRRGRPGDRHLVPPGRCGRGGHLRPGVVRGSTGDRRGVGSSKRVPGTRPAVQCRSGPLRTVCGASIRQDRPVRRRRQRATGSAGTASSDRQFVASVGGGLLDLLAHPGGDMTGAPADGRLALGVRRGDEQATGQTGVLQEVDQLLLPVLVVLGRPEAVTGGSGRHETADECQRGQPGRTAQREHRTRTDLHGGVDADQGDRIGGRGLGQCVLGALGDVVQQGLGRFGVRNGLTQLVDAADDENGREQGPRQPA